VPCGALIMVVVIMPPSARYDTACGMRCWPLRAAIRDRYRPIASLTQRAALGCV
jgi:hypothetical protein